METQPKISVVMATYNGSSWLNTQLQSILNQTRSPDEIIVVDDCSHDSTREILQQSLSLPQHRIILNHKNMGSTLSFGQGIEHATGDIIFLADQDDIWDKKKIEVQSTFLINNPQVGLVWSEIDLIDDLGKSLPYKKRVSHEKIIARGNVFNLLMKENTIGGLTMAFRKELKKYILPIPDPKLWHDYWIAVIAAVVTDISRVNLPLVHYRVHASNQVGVENSWTKITKRIEALYSGGRHWGGNTYIYAHERLKPWENNLDNKKYTTLSESALHHNQRKNMPSDRFGRLSLILKELLSGHYHKYSTQGFFSALQDFIKKSD